MVTFINAVSNEFLMEYFVKYKKIMPMTLKTTLFFFAYFSVQPLLGPYLYSMGFSKSLIGFLFAFNPLLVVFLSPSIGHLSDKVGRRIILSALTTLMFVAFTFYLVFDNFVMIAIANIMMGLSINTFWVISIAKIEDKVSNNTRGKYSGIFMSITHVGYILGPLIGAFVADYSSVRTVLMISIVLLCIVLLSLKPRPTKIHFKLSLSPIKGFFAIKKLRGMAVLGFAMHASQPVTHLFLPIYIISELGKSYADLGVILFASGFFAIFQFLFGRLSDKYGSRRMIIIGTLITGTCFIILAYTNTILGIAILMAIRSFGSSLWNVSAWSFLSTIGENIKHEGAVLSSQVSISKIGGIIGYALSGIIVSTFGFSVFFIVSGTIVVLATLLSRFMLFKD